SAGEAMARRAVDSVALLAPGQHLLLAAEVTRHLRWHLEHPSSVVLRATGLQIQIHMLLDRHGALDPRTHGATVEEETARRLGIVAVLIVHVADGNDGGLVPVAAPAARSPHADGKRQGEHEERTSMVAVHWATSSSTSSTWVACRESTNVRVRSRSNFSSSASMEMKNLSSEHASKRFEKNTGC